MPGLAHFRNRKTHSHALRRRQGLRGRHRARIDRRRALSHFRSPIVGFRFKLSDVQPGSSNVDHRRVSPRAQQVRQDLPRVQLPHDVASLAHGLHDQRDGVFFGIAIHKGLGNALAVDARACDHELPGFKCLATPLAWTSDQAISGSTLLPLGPPMRCALIPGEHASRAWRAFTDTSFRISDGPALYKSNSCASHHRSESQFRLDDVEFSHLETYKMAFMTFCPNCVLTVVFLNRLLHTPQGLEFVPRKWGCSKWQY